MKIKRSGKKSMRKNADVRKIGELSFGVLFLLFAFLPAALLIIITVIVFNAANSPVAEPRILYVWLPIVTALFSSVYFYNFMWKQRMLSHFGERTLIRRVNPHIQLSVQMLKAALTLCGIILLMVSLARPQWGERQQEIRRQSLDIIVAIDLSTSMMADDIKPNRLERAKQELAAFVEGLQGDRIGIVAFAGDAHLICPLTVDYGAVRMYLNAIDVTTIPVRGTAIAAAIDKARGAFNQQERDYKVVVLLTDGEDHEGNPVQAARAAAKEGVVIYTVGIGSPGGAPVPDVDKNGNVIGIRPGIVTRLDSVSLDKIAYVTHGSYYPATQGELELRKVLEDIMLLKRKEIGTELYAFREDQYLWFLIAAIVCFVAELLIPDRKRLSGKMR